MASREPKTTLLSQFSSGDAAAVPWSVGRDLLESAEIFWLATVRPDGRPHVTPLMALWLDGALHFSTGPDERKAKNLAQNPHCVITTGCNAMSEGLDIVVEGMAVEVKDDETRLAQLAGLYGSKYGWHYVLQDGKLIHEGARVPLLVYAVTPETSFGFGRGETFSQTRWRF